jgi:hypothetical protein
VRFGGARTTVLVSIRSSHLCLSAVVPAFAEPDIHSLSRAPLGPSQKIESVFSPSPETIRREPREFDLRRSVGQWQDLAACALCDPAIFFPRQRFLGRRSGNVLPTRSPVLPDPRRADTRPSSELRPASLARNAQRVISQDKLLDEVWSYQNYSCTRTVDNHMLRLRQKLESDPSHPSHFLTVHGVGYKFLP